MDGNTRTSLCPDPAELALVLKPTGLCSGKPLLPSAFQAETRVHLSAPYYCALLYEFDTAAPHYWCMCATL